MNEVLYFTPAEFMLLLELSSGGECSLLSDGVQPEEEELTLAFTTLFQRGMLRRQGEGFVPEGRGKLFEKIRNAPWAVCLSGPEGERAVCYVREEELWLVELADVILTRQYRVRQMDRLSIEQWLFDSELLDRSLLTQEELTDLIALEEELPDLRGRPLLCLEKRRNGGPVIELYEVYQNGVRREISRNGQNVNYTQEALSQMLTDCFGKERYDRC